MTNDEINREPVPDPFRFEKEILDPKVGDTLISEGGDKTLFADWIVGKWTFYPDAYKKAAGMLVEAMNAEPGDDVLILPIVFMYRHFVELKLKDIILALDKLSGTNMPTDEFGVHKLNPLWSYVRSHLDCIRCKPGNPEILQATEDLIRELSDLDPDSFHFRYAYDRKLLKEMQLPPSLNMSHFKSGMEKIENGLRYIDGGIDSEIADRAIDIEWRRAL